MSNRSVRLRQNVRRPLRRRASELGRWVFLTTLTLTGCLQGILVKRGDRGSIHALSAPIFPPSYGCGRLLASLHRRVVPYFAANRSAFAMVLSVTRKALATAETDIPRRRNSIAFSARYW